jgi:hypothetical protein
MCRRPIDAVRWLTPRALGVLLRSIVVEREPIYRQQETVHGFASGLYGLSAEQLEHLSDDRLGRALDHLFQADRAALLTAGVVAVGRRFELSSSVYTTTAPLSPSVGNTAINDSADLEFVRRRLPMDTPRTIVRI